MTHIKKNLKKRKSKWIKLFNQKTDIVRMGKTYDLTILSTSDSL